MDAVPELEERFRERRECFAALWGEHVAQYETAFGLRATLLPWAPLRVADLGRLKLPAEDLKLEPNTARLHEIYPCMGDGMSKSVNVGQPGRVRRGFETVNVEDDRYDRRLACEDGLVGYLIIDNLVNNNNLHLGPPMAIIGNALLAIEGLRRACGDPRAEFELEVEIRAKGGVRVIDYESRSIGNTLKDRPCLRMHTVGQKEGFNDIRSAVEDDFCVACDLKKPKTSISIDFESALQKLYLC